MAAIIMFLMIPVIAAAQGEHPTYDKMSREKIDAQKSAFITTELGLTTQESRDFWPVYDEYQGKKRKLLKANKEKCMALQEKLDSLTPNQQEQLADCPIDFEQQMLDLKKEYHAKYKKVIPAVKLAKLYKAEREFKMMLMKQMRSAKGHKSGPGPRPENGKPGEEHPDGHGGPGGYWDWD